MPQETNFHAMSSLWFNPLAVRNHGFPSGPLKHGLGCAQLYGRRRATLVQSRKHKLHPHDLSTADRWLQRKYGLCVGSEWGKHAAQL